MSDRYWLHVFYDDGREETINCGKLRGDEGPHVAVWVDFKCKRGWKGKVRPPEHPEIGREVEHASGVYGLKDMRVVRDGGRILMVMPKNMVAVV